MNLVDRIKEKRAAPPTQGFSGFGGTLGFDTGQPTVYGDYLSTSNGFFAAANLRAKSIAKLPWIIQEPDGSVLHDHDLLDLLRRPNPHFTPNKLRRLTELAMCVWAEYFWVLEAWTGGIPGVGRPREIWGVKPTIMKAIPDEDDYLRGFVLTPPGGGKPIPFSPKEVVWFIQPDPNNDFQPLSPLGAARLAADTESGMMKANRNLFGQGMIGSGFVFPPTDQQTFSDQQIQDLERDLDKRFRGVDKAHRFSVMHHQFKVEAMNVSPKDAQWIEGLDKSFEHICAALGVQPELLARNKNATLANVKEFERALWEHTVTDEVDFFGSEATRQLGPIFNLTPLQSVGMDLSKVVALQDDENLAWSRNAGKLDRAVLTINEVREQEGLDDVEWGHEPWLQRLVRQPGDEDPLGASEPERSHQSPVTRALPADQFGAEENAHINAMRALFNDQESEILRHLRARGYERSLESVKANPFDKIKWRKRTRAALDAKYVAGVEKSILLESKALNMTAEEIAEALTKRATGAAIEQQTKRFARQVNKTTWERVQGALVKSIKKGETLEQATSRVKHIMDIRRSDAKRIAQTEMTRARTTGQMAAFTTAGVEGKEWVTAGDGDVRDSHDALSGAVIPVLDDFAIGIGHGPGPGQSGVAEEDVNCRCNLRPRGIPKKFTETAGNGQHRTTEDDMRVLLESMEVTV